MAISMAMLCLGQDWNRLPGGDVINSTEYVGARAGSTVPLRLSTIPSLPIEFRTANTLRMRLNETTSYTIGNAIFGLQNADGYLGLSPNASLWTAPSPGPFSRLHLHDGAGAPLQLSYRPWMDNGITFTTNNDHMYVGHKVEDGVDQTAAVIQWADNDGAPAGPDVLKFLFTAGYSGGNYGISGLNGLEIARMHPQGYLGVGNWQAVGLQPTERVDLLTGRLRIRQLPVNTAGPATLTKVLFVDDVDPVSGEFGVVKWRDLSDIIPPADPCASGWFLNGANPVTAYDNNPCPPQSIHRVGIGTPAPIAKLHVVKDVSNGLAQERGVFVQQSLSSLQNYGVDAESVGAQGGGFNYGVRGYARNAGRNYGVLGEAVGGASQSAYGVFATCSGPNQVFGVRSTASNGLSNTAMSALAMNGTVNIGVDGIASGTGSSTANYGVRGTASGPNSWAGWFDGNVNIEGGNLYINQVFAISDESLKTDVADAGPVMDLVLSLQPRQYEYAVDLHPELGLPQGKRFGLIAQELEEHLPELVSLKVRPAQIDSSGEYISEEYSYKTVDYAGLVPVLLAGLQEQQEQMDEMKDQLAAMQEALASCCAPSDDGSLMQAPLDSEGEPKNDPALERLLRIDPNPFTEATTVRYTLERAGRAQLLVNSSDGKQLQVLHEGNTSAGDHSYDWSTGHLAPGIYYVTLLLDGEPLVKRAVKVR